MDARFVHPLSWRIVVHSRGCVSAIDFQGRTPNQKVSVQLEVSKFATGRIRRGGPALQVVVNKP